MKNPPEAWHSANLFELGLGYVVISRYKTGGRVEAGFFLLDVFCLGVKDADFQQFDSIEEFQKMLLDQLFWDQKPTVLSASAARKLVEGAVNYARGLGFHPCAGYKFGCRIFGGISSADSGIEFVFGKDDKPFFVQGMSDSPSSIAKILHALESHCGKDGFDYMIETEPATEDGITPELAASESLDPQSDEPLRAGEGKVSEQIRAIAQPLLAFAPDEESVAAVLRLAVMAWNFTLLGPLEQENVLAEMDDMLHPPERRVMFLYLANRMVQFCPTDKRVIRRARVIPATAGVQV